MHPAFITALVTATANQGHHFHIGPWIIVPILIVLAVVGAIVYVVRDRRARSRGQTR